MKLPLKRTDPEDLSGDVGNPVLLQCVALGVLHQICDGPSATELHHQLEEREDTEKNVDVYTHTHTHTHTQRCTYWGVRAFLGTMLVDPTP